jgi:hypothetical protein
MSEMDRIRAAAGQNLKGLKPKQREKYLTDMAAHFALILNNISRENQVPLEWEFVSSLRNDEES